MSVPGPPTRVAVTTVVLVSIGFALAWSVLARNQFELGAGDNESNQFTFITQAVAAIFVAGGILISRGASLARAAKVSILTWLATAAIVLALYVVYALIALSLLCDGGCSS